MIIFSRKFAGALAISMAALVLASLSHARATLSPKSKLLVVMKITTDDGRVVNARASAGSLVKLRKDGKAFGLTPVVRDEEGLLVEFVVSRHPGGGGAPEEVERVKVKGKETKATSTSPSFSLQVERLERIPDETPQSAGLGGRHRPPGFRPVSYAPQPARPLGVGPAPYDEVCCVSCPDGLTACANCAVIIQGCGSCTAGDCQDGDPWWDND